MQAKRCDNDNHGRAIVTVRCCPTCGRIVNAKIPVRTCTQAEHAQARRRQLTFCMNCGESLAAGRIRR